MKHALLAASLLALPSAAHAVEPVAQPLALSIAARTPVAVVGAASGIGTAEARATGRVTEASAREQCAGFLPEADVAGVRDCAAAWLKQFPNDMIANADCRAGILRPVGGGSYRYAGEWPKQEIVGVGRSQWRGGDGEIVGTSTAEGGLSLSQQWETLCGASAKPRPAQPAEARPVEARLAPTPVAFGEQAPPESGSQNLWDHNGSEVWLDPGTGVISYEAAKPAMRAVVRRGSVLFRGRLGADRAVQGTAYAFKEGCPPAPYPVRGAYSRDGGTLVLRGLGPVREGCTVVAYTERSPHATLRFVSLMSP
ncbi:hypothetical protein [Methylobacterium trifolii]|uniref:Uncharacterized protein n=1 Tax=Methylobacterium trifolii TaxID=1003092 RepID=A0ABQ4TUS2_9HYPH|nr:hypothetical protein [Methylobacterium trifolii]GJE59041.1 hypothetical protein MPOCJGCO_1128 [Methylobacterium trifolii]